jgi:hypothetical protein
LILFVKSRVILSETNFHSNNLSKLSHHRFQSVFAQAVIFSSPVPSLAYSMRPLISKLWNMRKIRMLCVLTQLTYIFIVFWQLGCPLLLLPVGRLLMSSKQQRTGLLQLCVPDGNRDYIGLLITYYW